MENEKEAANIIIINIDWLVTLDSDRRIIRNGAIAIQDSKIAAVGRADDIKEKYNSQKIIDATGKMAVPGFVEAHIHNVQQLARGLAENVENPRWSAQRIYPYESEMTSEDAYCSALLCQIEMLKVGTTSFIDPGNYYPEETARAAVQTGMRGIVTRSTFDISEGGFRTLPQKMFRETLEETTEKAEEFVARWPRGRKGSEARVSGSMSLRSLLNCSNELCIKVAELADKYDTIIQAHAAFNAREVSSSFLAHGKRDLVRLEDLGVLNDRWALTHMGWLSPPEMRLVLERDVKVIHCPGASAHLAYGSFLQGIFPELLEMGATIGLGSDAAAAANFVDMVRNMYLSSCIYKDMRLDATVMPPELVLEMATLHGAAIGGWEGSVGAIQDGFAADITLLRVDEPEWIPMFNPIANLVYSATGRSADTVIVDGQIVMSERKILTVDEGAVLREAQGRAETIAERGGLAKQALPAWPIVN